MMNILKKVVKFFVVALRRIAGIAYLIPAIFIAVAVWLVSGVFAICIVWPLEWIFTGDDWLVSIIVNFMSEDLWEFVGVGFEFIVGDN